MRRRKQKGVPLLWKIAGISVLAHLIALPILARFGVFEKVERQFTDVQMVTLPPPETEKPKPTPKEPVKKTPRVAAAKRGTANHPRTASARQSNLSQPKVVVAQGGPGSGGDSGPTVDPNGTGAAGALPTEAATAPSPAPSVAPEPTPAPAVTPAPEPTPSTAPVVTPTPVPTPQPTPRPPTFTEAVPLDMPKPTLPDTLRSETLDRTTVAEFVVGTDGAPVEVRVVQSAGIRDLDNLALEAARQWRFKPATRDGVPVQSTVRLHVAFQVS